MASLESYVNKYQENLHLAREKITQLRKEKDLIKEELQKTAENSSEVRQAADH